MKAAGLVVAAGRGERAGGGVAKQFQPLFGVPMVTWSIRALRAVGAFPIVVVLPEGAEQEARHCIDDGARTTWGGSTRSASVRAGLDALGAAEIDAVFVHDAARPGLTSAMASQLWARLAEGYDGVAPALPAADALKRVDDDGVIVGELGRDGLARIQTPQLCRLRALRAAMAQDGDAFDDELTALRKAGYRVATTPGSPLLMKVTYPEDFAVMERLLAPTPGRICTGLGFDAHRFGEGAFVTLCGVKIAHARGLIGHSDADAAWHALTDAILGACGLGDIGDHFPPSDARWRGAASEIFLRAARDLAAGVGAVLENVDVTIIAEQPKIAPHRAAMRARTAEVLGLPIERVSVKATTTEGMGFCGRGEGLAAQAVVSARLPL